MIVEHGESQIVVDYVLGLLPAAEQRELENHLSTCEPCRNAVGRERAAIAAVRQTIAMATRPDAGRMQQLMPPVTRRRWYSPVLDQPIWRPATALALLLILFLGVLQSDLFLEQPGSDAILSSPSATTLVATATTTPTATQAGTVKGEQAIQHPNEPVVTAFMISPRPPGTRLAALPGRNGSP